MWLACINESELETFSEHYTYLDIVELFVQTLTNELVFLGRDVLL